jgi:hypothetical protein
MARISYSVRSGSDVRNCPRLPGAQRPLDRDRRHGTAARVEFDLLDFYHNESRILGADSRKLGLVESAAILHRLAPLFDSGSLEAPLIDRKLPLQCGLEAIRWSQPAPAS